MENPSVEHLLWCIRNVYVQSVLLIKRWKNKQANCVTNYWERRRDEMEDDDGRSMRWREPSRYIDQYNDKRRAMGATTTVRNMQCRQG